LLALRNRQDDSVYEFYIGLPPSSSSAQAAALNARVIPRFPGQTIYVGTEAPPGPLDFFFDEQASTPGSVILEAFQPVETLLFTVDFSADTVTNNPENRCYFGPAYWDWTKATTVAQLMDVLVDGKLDGATRFASREQIARATAAAVSGIDIFWYSYNSTYTVAGFEKDQPNFFSNFSGPNGWMRTGAGENLVIVDPDVGIHFTLLTARNSGDPEDHYFSQPTEAMLKVWRQIEPPVA
jgi:hypothetical protein